MFSPRYTGSEMWSFLTSPMPSTPANGTPRFSPFDEKRYELDQLKKKVQLHLGKLNVLKADYMDWFKRKHKSFLNVVKYVQITLPNLVPMNIKTFKEYKELVAMCHKLIKSGMRVKDSELLEDFLTFVERLAELKLEGDDVIYAGIVFFCSSITRLRHPEVRGYIEQLQERYTEEFNDNFDFSDIHNEKDILFTYTLNTVDQQFLGLVQYLPYILQIARKVCYFALKLHVEKE